MKNILKFNAIYIWLLMGIVILSGCIHNNENEVVDITPTKEAMPTSTLTPTYTSTPYLNLFDDGYTNIINANQRLIYDGKSIWHTTGSYLYYVNLETQTKQLMETRLISGSIYIYDENVYYLTKESINRININTLQASIVLDAKGICEKVHQSDLNAENERFADFVILDDLLLFRFFATSENHGEPSGKVWCRIDELEFYLQTGPTEIDISNQIPYIEVERVNTQLVLYGDIEVSVLTWNRIDSEVQNLIGVSTSSYFIGEEQLTKSDEKFTIFTRINNNRITIYDIRENEIIYEAFPSADTKVSVNTLNQYGIISYYEESEEGTFIDGNVILIDRMNEIVYENNEIDYFIEGDIDYTNLVLADYYQTSNEVYVMENQYIKNYFYSDDRSERLNTDALNTGHMFTEIPVLVNIYKVEIVNGKLNFALIYSEFS